MADEFTRDLQNKYDENFKRVSYWIYVCWFTCLLSLLLPFLIGEDFLDRAQLFQRAGAMLVMFAILSDIQIRAFSRFTKVKDIGVDYINMDNQYRAVWFDKVTAVIAVLGTAIWGCGDIFILKLIFN